MQHLLLTKDCSSGAEHATPALPVTPASVVGAGDGFLGAMVWGLDAGLGIEEAFRHGVAGGSAALLSGGTGLCKAEEVRRLYPQVHLRRL